MNTKYTLLFPTLLCCLGMFAQKSNWVTREFGPCPTLKTYDIEVADGRNDGTNRIYVSTMGPKSGTSTTGVYEWIYSNGSWNYTTVKSGILALVTLAVGDGRNDGVNRVYFTEFTSTGRLFEATWANNQWNVVELIPGTKYNSLCVYIGQGRNDGKNRVYLSAPGAGLFEYTYGNGSWTKLQISAAAGGEGVGCIGDTRNDGVNRLCQNGKAPYDITWKGSSYDIDTLTGTTDWPDASFIAPGRNDGVNRVYTNTNKGRMEYTWNGTGWSAFTVDTTHRRGDYYLAKTKNDGKYHAYTTMSAAGLPPGPLFEYTWNGSTYSKDTVVDAISGATAMVTAGIGRNDDTVRLYAPNWAKGTIYEITNKTPLILSSATESIQNVIQHNFSFSAYPNPTHSNINVSVSNSKNIALELQLIDAQGKTVYQKLINNSYTDNINLQNYSPGLYFIKLGNEKEGQVMNIVIE